MRAPYWLEVLGVVCHRGVWRIYSGTSAEWVLDYPSYDPTVLDPGEPDFRAGVHLVDVTSADEFLAALADYELTPSQVLAVVAESGPLECPLAVVVDFDKAVLVNGYSEIPLQDYVPAGWSAREGDPLQYVPKAIRDLWQPDR